MSEVGTAGNKWCLTKSLSKQRDRIGVTENEWTSDNCWYGLTLGIGVTIECFHDAGGWPQDRVTECNMSDYWGKLDGAVFVNQWGIGSEPEDVRLL